MLNAAIVKIQCRNTKVGLDLGVGYIAYYFRERASGTGIINSTAHREEWGAPCSPIDYLGSQYSQVILSYFERCFATGGGEETITFDDRVFRLEILTHEQTPDWLREQVRVVGVFTQVNESLADTPPDQRLRAVSHLRGTVTGRFKPQGDKRVNLHNVPKKELHPFKVKNDRGIESEPLTFSHAMISGRRFKVWFTASSRIITKLVTADTGQALRDIKTHAEALRAHSLLQQVIDAKGRITSKIGKYTDDDGSKHRVTVRLIYS
ncbi:hypothetical protein [Vibrio phage 29Fa.3]|nr:hypothetical protein [Vibrio phage 29Fa.3]